MVMVVNQFTTQAIGQAAEVRTLLSGITLLYVCTLVFESMSRYLVVVVRMANYSSTGQEELT